MRPVEWDDQAVRRELDLVLGSEGFARNERLSRFLRFVVERRLEGRDPELKESVIAIEIFGRSPDYDPRRDPIVRTEATRLRARLSQYYVGEGKDDALRIELPKGGYSPCFHQSPPASAMSPAPPVVEKTPHHWLWFASAGCCCTVALAAAILWTQRQKAPIPIAVLPLTNLSQDPANDYFADGLTDEIIRNLSVLEGLAVRSQTSSFAFKRIPRDVRRARRQLGVEYILEGSVMRAAQQLRINVQLVRVRDDFPLWSGRYDRELTDVFTIQDEISRGIVNHLRLKLGRGRRHYETSVEAYDLYLRGRASIQPPAGQENFAVASFEQAIAKDPLFAPAYAGLAAIRAIRSGLFSLDASDEVPKMREAAKKAIELDPLLPEAHEAMGMACAREAEWVRSEESFRRAIELDPNRSETREHFALYVLWPLGRTEEALRELRLAEKADPLSQLLRWLLASMLPSAGRYDEAARYAALAQNASLLGRARYLEGKTADAIQILEKAFHGGIGISAGSEIRAYLGYAYARADRRNEAETLAVGTNPFNQAVIFAGLGDKERALEAMERSTAARPFRVGRQLTWPELAIIRNDPRMKALRKKLGLPE
jgi:TolB-like protein/Flp pilus assembly protein TadD